jgi:hypothetical protein
VRLNNEDFRSFYSYIKMNLKQTWSDYMEWMLLAQDRDQCSELGGGGINYCTIGLHERVADLLLASEKGLSSMQLVARQLNDIR